MDQGSEHEAGPATPLPQHTPGPWRVVEAGGFWIVPAAPVSGIDELAQELAGPDITIVPVPLDSEANARLIAASPDLLTFAAKVAKQLHNDPIRAERELADEALRLVAKTEGREQ